MGAPRRRAVQVLFMSGIIAATLFAPLLPLESATVAQPRAPVRGDIFFSPT